MIIPEIPWIGGVGLQRLRRRGPGDLETAHCEGYKAKSLDIHGLRGLIESAGPPSRQQTLHQCHCW